MHWMKKIALSIDKPELKLVFFNHLEYHFVFSASRATMRRFSRFHSTCMSSTEKFAACGSGDYQPPVPASAGSQIQSKQFVAAKVTPQRWRFARVGSHRCRRCQTKKQIFEGSESWEDSIYLVHFVRLQAFYGAEGFGRKAWFLIL